MEPHQYTRELALRNVKMKGQDAESLAGVLVQRGMIHMPCLSFGEGLGVQSQLMCSGLRVLGAALNRCDLEIEDIY